MSFKQTLENFIGDCLGYSRCPVTGDTYLCVNRIALPVSRTGVVLIRSDAFDRAFPKEIAKRVLERCGSEKVYSEREIVEEIKKGNYQTLFEPSSRAYDR